MEGEEKSTALDAFNKARGDGTKQDTQEEYVKRLEESVAKFQDFACGVSNVVWGGELGWERADGLKKLLKEVVGIVQKHNKRKNEPTHLSIKVKPRYWEDATVNGVEDEEGFLIPLRLFDIWRIVIDIKTGRINDWPYGKKASIHYKVCDDGEYWLTNADLEPIFKLNDSYVPDFLSIGDNGCGDYIILEIDEEGNIDGWRTPDVTMDEWERV